MTERLRYAADRSVCVRPSEPLFEAEVGPFQSCKCSIEEEMKALLLATVAQIGLCTHSRRRAGLDRLCDKAACRRRQRGAQHGRLGLARQRQHAGRLSDGGRGSCSERTRHRPWAQARAGGPRACRKALLGATLNFLERLVDKFIHHVSTMACSITNELLANCTNLLRSRHFDGALAVRLRVSRSRA